MERLKYLLINIFGVLVLADVHAGIREGVMCMPGYRGGGSSYIELANSPFWFWVSAAFLYFIGLGILASGASDFVFDISSDTSANDSNDGGNFNRSLFITVIIAEFIASLVVGIFWM